LDFLVCEAVFFFLSVLIVSGGVAVISWETVLGTVWEHWIGITFSKTVSEVVGMVSILIGTVPMRIWLVTRLWIGDWFACSISTVFWTRLTRF
jgi:hypothetical protein